MWKNLASVFNGLVLLCWSMKGGRRGDIALLNPTYVTTFFWHDVEVSDVIVVQYACLKYVSSFLVLIYNFFPDSFLNSILFLFTHNIFSKIFFTFYFITTTTIHCINK